MDEPIVVDADGDPFDNDERLDLPLGPFDCRLAEARPEPCQPLAPFLGGIGMEFLHPRTLHAQGCARVAPAVPPRDELLKTLVMRRYVNGELDQLVATAAVLCSEAAPLQAQQL